MKALLARLVVVMLVVAIAHTTQSVAALAQSAPSRAPVEVYTATVDQSSLKHLLAMGFDAGVVGRTDEGRYELQIVLSEADSRRLATIEPNLALELWRTTDGLTFAESSRIKQEEGYKVYRPWDGEGGLAEEIDAVVAGNPEFVKKLVIGQSVQGRDIVALKLTEDANQAPDGTRPAVLFSSTQHAREWLATEVGIRLLHHFVDGYRSDPMIAALLDEIEVWFVPVANPDGYQYTFDVNRDWRKNLQDNDGDGEITSADGVDPNRNFDAHWGYDTIGSSTFPFAVTYRGPGPASEPETVAMQDLMKRIEFVFQVNYHSASELILYPVGWQDETESADNPVAVALAGTRLEPGIAGFLPIPSAALYIANGETCDYAASVGTLCFTPELTIARCPGCTWFEFPDDEELLQAEFELNLPFAMDVAMSTLDPAHPVSHLGHAVEPIYVDDFHVSYGDPQPVQANVARYLGDATMMYRINDGVERAVATFEWQGGERYGEDGDATYRRVRGQVAGAKPGDTVEVWFEAGGEMSRAFTYSVADTTGARVLVLAAEDYTGISPELESSVGPLFLQTYLDALARNEIAADVYDIDAEGRRAPSPLGVLSHYEAVVWYTGDDIITREPAMMPGTASRLARDTMVAVRDYLNEGGHLMYIGNYAGFQFYDGSYEFDPEENAPCDPGSDQDGCRGLKYDFVRYYLGAYNYIDEFGVSASGSIHPVKGTAGPFDGMVLEFPEPSPSSEAHTGAFESTGLWMPPEEYPQFTSWPAAIYSRPGDNPRTGEHAVYSGQTWYSYQRLSKEVDLASQDSASLTFWISRQTRSPYDAVFVEVHTVGEDDWTTLADLNGHTSPNAALSCRSDAWYSRFPQLAHYMTRESDGRSATCRAEGTTGTWNAATGGSDGDYEQWQVELNQYAGKNVEVAITYLSSQQAYWGVLIDDVSLSTGESTSFEEDLGGWVVSGAPPEHDPNASDYFRATTQDLPQPTQSAIMVTDDTMLVGFGLEELASQEVRADFMRRAMEHLLPEVAPPPSIIYLPVLTTEHVSK